MNQSKPMDIAIISTLHIFGLEGRLYSIVRSEPSDRGKCPTLYLSDEKGRRVELEDCDLRSIRKAVIAIRLKSEI